MTKKINVGVVGATGLVGRQIIQVLQQRQFPVENVRLFASQRSRGTKIECFGKLLEVEDLSQSTFSGLDLILASAGAQTSKTFAKRAVESGAVVIDNSSAFRLENDCPLVVPEVNPEAIFSHHGIIANPNCSTIGLVCVLWPIHKNFGLRRVVVSTYQAVSGAGFRALQTLMSQSRDFLEERSFSIEVFPHQIAFNLIPCIGGFDQNGYCIEENKIILESRKIMGIPDLKITATTVRVPTQNVHCESVSIETYSPIDPTQVRVCLKDAPNVVVVDNPAENLYPMPIIASGRDEVFVGRIRKDESVENGILLFLAFDNLRKGAATNAIQIAERLFGIEKGYL